VAFYYLRPHDGSLALGPFTTSDDAVAFYHSNLEYSGCDVILAIDPSEFPTEGASMVRRFEFQEPPAD